MYMIDYILRQFNADCTIDQLVCHIGIDHLPDITISCIKCIQLHGTLVNARNRFKTLKYDFSKCKAILTKKQCAVLINCIPCPLGRLSPKKLLEAIMTHNH